jgi:hypothetical protein
VGKVATGLKDWIAEQEITLLVLAASSRCHFT